MKWAVIKANGKVVAKVLVDDDSELTVGYQFDHTTATYHPKHRPDCSGGVGCGCPDFYGGK